MARFSPLINQVAAFLPITQVQSSIITSLTQSPSFTQIIPQIAHSTSLVTNANSSHQPAAVHSHSGLVNSLHQPAAVHSHSGLVNSLPQPVAGHSHSASPVNPSHQPAWLHLGPALFLSMYYTIKPQGHKTIACMLTSLPLLLSDRVGSTLPAADDSIAAFTPTLRRARVCSTIRETRGEITITRLSG